MTKFVLFLLITANPGSIYSSTTLSNTEFLGQDQCESAGQKAVDHWSNRVSRKVEYFCISQAPTK